MGAFFPDPDHLFLSSIDLLLLTLIFHLSIDLLFLTLKVIVMSYQNVLASTCGGVASALYPCDISSQNRPLLGSQFLTRVLGYNLSLLFFLTRILIAARSF